MYRVPRVGQNCGGRGDQGGQLEGLLGRHEDVMPELSDRVFSLSMRVNNSEDNYNNTFAVENEILYLFTSLTSLFWIDL